MIKILYILEATSGGTQKHVVDVAKKIDRSEFQIDIVYSTIRNKNFVLESNGIFNKMFGLPITRSGSPSDIVNILKIRKIIKENNYDIVHCHSTKAGFVGLLATFISRHPNVVYSPHGFMFCDTRIKLRRLLYLYLEKYLRYLTNKVIAVSGSERDLALQHNIVPNNKIITLYISIDPSDFDDFSYENRVPEKLSNKNSDISLGTVGRLYYQKDPLTLIKSFKIINDRFPKTKLIIVGDGPLESLCIKLIRELGLEKKIELAGYQKNSKSYYRKFDIFILSSHYEGLPYALFTKGIQYAFNQTGFVSNGLALYLCCSAASEDSDQDGLPDAFERFYFDSLSRSGDQDFDGDGLSNLCEFRAGTDPRSPASCLRCQLPQLQASKQYVLSWCAIPGRNYRVWQSTNLAVGDWSLVTPQPIPGAPSGFNSYTGTVDFAASPSFWRVSTP